MLLSRALRWWWGWFPIIPSFPVKLEKRSSVFPLSSANSSHSAVLTAEMVRVHVASFCALSYPVQPLPKQRLHESLGGGVCVSAPCYKRTAHLTQLIRSLLQRVAASHGTLSHSHEAIISQMHANVCMYCTYALYNVICRKEHFCQLCSIFLNNTPTSNV